MEELILWKNDPWLEPWKKKIMEVYQKTTIQRLEIAGYGQSLASAVNSHLFYGVFHDNKGNLIFREWAPNSKELYLIGEVNSWKKDEKFRFSDIGDGNRELVVPKKLMPHGSLYKWLICWEGGSGERIPAYATRVVQDLDTKLFSAQIWSPDPYKWKHSSPPKRENPLIYEAHIGMSSSSEHVAGFDHFRKNVLPRIADLGYNTIQLMAIQEHPYYGSFGYQVSGFYAVSSRFGTPEQLKELIDEAHSLNISVIMDIVHSHSVDNVLEGLSMFDGTDHLYFHPGERGRHPAWTSRCFDYGKDEVIRFLLSNCKYWLEEYNLDGFRFDGVTSMIYHDHGLERNFTDYSHYFDGNQDVDALVYLSLANMVVKEVKPTAITIAEEMSGYPGLAAPFSDGGIGFDFRMSMGVPDHWIKWIKELRDEDWNVSEMYHQLTSKRADEKTVSYAECHDQAMVGDKTIIFRLMDSEMYTGMAKEIPSLTADRAIALHKMIRLVTLSAAGNGYLNFMGNEFGHPEWIDFPREGNGWSYKYARRQWELADNKLLRYNSLLKFDREMIHLASETGFFSEPPQPLYMHNERQIMIFSRGPYIFAFNFSPLVSYENFSFYAPRGEYRVVLDTDSGEFGGFGRNSKDISHVTLFSEGGHKLFIYLPCRCGIVLKNY